MIVDVTDLTPLRRQDHETQKAYEARVARVEKQRVSHMRKLGLRPDLPNGYDLTEKQRARARGMCPSCCTRRGLRTG